MKRALASTTLSGNLPNTESAVSLSHWAMRSEASWVASKLSLSIKTPSSWIDVN